MIFGIEVYQNRAYHQSIAQTFGYETGQEAYNDNTAQRESGTLMRCIICNGDMLLTLAHTIQWSEVSKQNLYRDPRLIFNWNDVPKCISVCSVIRRGEVFFLYCNNISVFSLRNLKSLFLVTKCKRQASWMHSWFSTTWLCWGLNNAQTYNNSLLKFALCVSDQKLNVQRIIRSHKRARRVNVGIVSENSNWTRNVFWKSNNALSLAQVYLMPSNV